MPTYPQIIFDSATSFRIWLSENHDKSTGVSLVFYKAHTGKRTFSYPQALDEALCFGWIDSTVRSIDDEKYCQNFTPRNNIKNWSEVNKLKVLKLIEDGKMTPAGLNKIDVYIKTGKLDWKHENIRKGPEPVPEMPDFFHKSLIQNPVALDNFQKLAASHKRTYLNWILTAKREETQLKRVTKAVEMLLRNEKPAIL
jgi:uncharacterized protein YdeI (YjbR/CyaY-like superfamily)